MEIMLNKSECADLVRRFGWDAFLQTLRVSQPQLDLYTVSTDWFYEGPYVCKAKGARGDLLVRWS